MSKQETQQTPSVLPNVLVLGLAIISLVSAVATLKHGGNAWVTLLLVNLAIVASLAVGPLGRKTLPPKWRHGVLGLITLSLVALVASVYF